VLSNIISKPNSWAQTNHHGAQLHPNKCTRRCAICRGTHFPVHCHGRV